MDRDTTDRPDEARAAEGADTPATTAGSGAQAGRAPRDNRRIVSGVQLLEGGAIRTHAGTSEADHDALEERLTPEQVERLKEAGALEGDWHGRGQPQPPMRGSRDAGGAQAAAGQAGGGASEELRQLRAENARLRQQVGAAAPAEDEGDGGEEHKARRPRGRHPH